MVRFSCSSKQPTTSSLIVLRARPEHLDHRSSQPTQRRQSQLQAWNQCKIFILIANNQQCSARIWSPCCRASTRRTSCPWSWNCWRGGRRLKDRELLLLHISYLWFVSHLTVWPLGSRLDLVKKAQVGVGATLGLWTSFDATVMKRWKEEVKLITWGWGWGLGCWGWGRACWGLLGCSSKRVWVFAGLPLPRPENNNC